MKELTLGGLKHHSFSEYYKLFLSLYGKLFTQDEFDESDREKIVSIIVLFNNLSDETMRRLGYRIALEYSNKTKDLTPLYDISINSGLLPVATLVKHINESMTEDERETFLSNIVDSYVDNFRTHGIVFTEQQYRLNQFFSDNLNNSATVVAPTSYGKSELIISGIQKSEGLKICIIVPSKALLAQTRKRVLNAHIAWVKRIVSHPEMHKKDDLSSVYILTQERLSRILNADKEMAFDIVFVDEAHNMLADDSRNVLLTSTVRTLEHRNSETAFKFLTPFLQEASSLRLKDSTFASEEYQIHEYVKSEKIFVADYRHSQSLFLFYDHFLNQFYELENELSDELTHVVSHSKNKNIIYLNKPKDTQRLARQLAASLPEVNSKLIRDAVAEIGEALHGDYLLLHCMKRGVLYHHGSMPDAVRNYAEYLYKECDEIRFLVSTSTLLEGVNLPIERMFILDNRKGLRKLTCSQFRNLIGRVNRFGDIFSSRTTASLEKLQPEVHIIGSSNYGTVNANLTSFVEDVMSVSKKQKDELDNILLDKVEISDDNRDKYNQVMTRLKNLEQGITKNFEAQKVTTQVGLKLLESNISEIDPFDHEDTIQTTLDERLESYEKINNSKALMETIYSAFIKHIDPNDRVTKNNLSRLEDEKAQSFYAMILDWKIEKLAFSRMIAKMLDYWSKLPAQTPVYVGTWGDTRKDDGHVEWFTYIDGKSIPERVNLAIVRIKEEEDFFEFVIFRFIEILNDLEMLDEKFYMQAKYGTLDPYVISLIRNGFSRGVAEILLKNYTDYFTFLQDGNIAFNPNIHARLKADKIGFIQRHEVQLNVAAEG